MRYLLPAIYYPLLVSAILGMLVSGGGVVIGLWWNYWVTGSEENLLYWSKIISQAGLPAFIASGLATLLKNFLD